MPKKVPLPALIFPPKSSREREDLRCLLQNGHVKKIAPRLYISVPKNQHEAVIRSAWATIVSNLFPKALLSHRSALEYKPSPQGVIFLTASTNRKVKLPGLTLQFVRGPGPRKDDAKFMAFHASSFARALLENLSTSHSDAVARNLSVAEIEQKLEALLLAKGEDGINEIRDQAKAIAKEFAWNKEFERLIKMIGAMLGTKSSKVLVSQSSMARAKNTPYDVDAVRRFQLLFGEVRNYPFPAHMENNLKPQSIKHKAFFEAYFSNYIEGTTFEIEEAEEIIFDKKIPKNRPADAHDIVGTFEIVANANEMRRVPSDGFAQFESLLKQRHLKLMASRNQAMPGEFKQSPNRAGNTRFVHPDYVLGTLIKGYEFYRDLPLGMARAIFMMFLVAEVHPFVDGNGRIARIMMNAELWSAGLSTIIIPTVYREDYLSGLRALTRRERPGPLVKMLLKAQKFSTLDFSNYPKVLNTLTENQWFLEPDDGFIQGVPS
jgi:hypothetical protein